MVGTSPPKLLRMPMSEIQERLAESSLDIGMCGLFLTLERLELFDFVNPFYQPSGFQAVVVSPTPQLSVSDLLLAMLGCFDSKTQLIGLFLLLFVFGFGHIAAALENFSFSEARNLRSGYGESTMDGMWIAANVMSSVRFGAVLPKSLPGRILTVVWAYLSIALTGMFVGLIISNFLAMRLIPDYPQYHIAQPTDLATFSIASSTAFAISAVQRYGNISVTEFPPNSQSQVFRALLNGDYQVAVEPVEVVQYFNNFVPEFEHRLMPVGEIFGQEGVSFGVSRPDSQEHPIYRLLSLTVAGLDESWMDSLRLKWFGPEADVTNSDATAIIQQVTIQSVDSLLWIMVKVLLILVGAWAAVAGVFILRRLPGHIARNEAYAAVRSALGMKAGEVTLGCHHTRAYPALKRRVLQGIRRFLPEDSSGCSVTPVQGMEPTAAGATAAGNTSRYHRRRLFGRPVLERSATVGTQGAGEEWLNVGALLDGLAAALASRRATASRWERLLGVDYARRGREYMRDAFFRCHWETRRVLDEARRMGTVQGLELAADDVADVLLELIAAEEHGLPVYVSLLFPHRSGGGSESKAERFIDQLAMTTLELENRISTAHAVAAAASSSCGTAISGSSGEAGADAGSTGEENAWFRRKVCWASSQW